MILVSYTISMAYNDNKPKDCLSKDRQYWLSFLTYLFTYLLRGRPNMLQYRFCRFGLSVRPPSVRLYGTGSKLAYKQECQPTLAQG